MCGSIGHSTLCQDSTMETPISATVLGHCSSEGSSKRDLLRFRQSTKTSSALNSSPTKSARPLPRKAKPSCVAKPIVKNRTTHSPYVRQKSEVSGFHRPRSAGAQCCYEPSCQEQFYVGYPCPCVPNTYSHAWCP